MVELWLFVHNACIENTLAVTIGYSMTCACGTRLHRCENYGLLRSFCSQLVQASEHQTRA